jgi:hypothetical protein
MPLLLHELEHVAWAVAEGRASAEDLALFEREPARARLAVGRLLDDTDERILSAQRLPVRERELVLADLEDDRSRLQAVWDVLTAAPKVSVSELAELAEIRLQASWSDGHVVVWAAGPGLTPEDNEQLADRLEAIGGPALGWDLHPGVPLPGGFRADALSIPVDKILGWLVEVGGRTTRSGVGASVAWLGRVALLGVRHVARGAVVPTLRTVTRPNGRAADVAVRWTPALVDDEELQRLAAVVPGPVNALHPQADARATTATILSAVVDAIVKFGARQLSFPAPPPVTHSAQSVAEAVATRLDGSTFSAPVAVVGQLGRRLEQWSRTVTASGRPRLIVQLDPPDRGGAWFCNVLGPGADGRPLPVEVALTDSKNTKPIADELARLERLYPVLRRPGALRRGQVVLSQDEAWELMTVVAVELTAAGFDLRLPALSRRKPTPVLRLFTMPTGESVVGAHQLANVRWSVVFGDVELSAAEITRLAAEARPLVRSGGRWVELDRLDLKEAAAALAERSRTTQMTGAEILRHAMGLEGSRLTGGIAVAGSGWATELFERARGVSTEPVTTPEGFRGELRSYQAEALAWLGFLDSAGLGGCLALDMGLGKTPTMLAHLGRAQAAARATADADGAAASKALVIAPPAVVGNWAREAAKFTPRLRVVLHHGARRADAAEFEAEIARADVVITTYGTAVRDIDVLAGRTWSRLVLDEAQAIKNPTNESAQQLRRIPARSRIALTGTPIENGLGDLWAILDFTNPGLVGPRATFVSQLAGEGEAALKALNGILVFRRTKAEPAVAAELPDRIDELDHCSMTTEQIGLYQAVLDRLIVSSADGADQRKGAVLAAITALKQICNHPANYLDDGRPLAGRSGKLARLEEIVEQVFAADEKVLIFTHFAEWGRMLATHLSQTFGRRIQCYDGSLARGTRDTMVAEFQAEAGAGALVLSLKAGGVGLNLTAASHVVLYDRWWNPAVEDQARDRAWRIGQTRTVISHRLVCPGTVDERVEEVVAGKRHIADLVLPASSSLSDLDAEQLRKALGLRPESMLTDEPDTAATLEEVG